MLRSSSMHRSRHGALNLRREGTVNTKDYNVINVALDLSTKRDYIECHQRRKHSYSRQHRQRSRAGTMRLHKSSKVYEIPPCAPARGCQQT